MPSRITAPELIGMCSADSTSPLGPGTIPPEQLPGSVPPSAAAWTPPPADKNSRTPDKNANGSFSIARQLGHASTELLFRVYSRFVPNLTRRDGSAVDRLLNATFASGRALNDTPDPEAQPPPRPRAA